MHASLCFSVSKDERCMQPNRKSPINCLSADWLTRELWDLIWIYQHIESWLLIQPDEMLYAPQTLPSLSSQVFFSNMESLFPEYADYDLVVPTFRSTQIMFWKSALTISIWCDFLVGLWDEPDSAWDGHIWYPGGEAEGRHKQRMYQSDMEVSDFVIWDQARAMDHLGIDQFWYFSVPFDVWSRVSNPKLWKRQ